MSGDALISEGIKDILVESGVGIFQPDAVDTDWVIVISRQRDKPNKMITIMDTGGFAPEPGLDINYPTIQIIVRGEPDAYVDAHAKCRQIKRFLLGRWSEVRNGDIWASIVMPNDILPLGYDGNERPEFSMNFNLIVHQGDLVDSRRQDTSITHPDIFWDDPVGW